jgi:hypothetical protein
MQSKGADRFIKSQTKLMFPPKLSSLTSCLKFKTTGETGGKSLTWREGAQPAGGVRAELAAGGQQRTTAVHRAVGAVPLAGGRGARDKLELGGYKSIAELMYQFNR